MQKKALVTHAQTLIRRSISDTTTKETKLFKWLLHRRLTLPIARAAAEQGHALQYFGTAWLLAATACKEVGLKMLNPRSVRFEAVDSEGQHAKSSLAT